MEAFARTTDSIVSLEEFKALLASGRKLKVKFGADVTAPFLHLGHAVNLWMMREMQERGHLVQFLIGDFTTRIGDPTGQNEARRVPTESEREENAREFLRQVGKVLVTDDPEVFEARRNSEWFGRMGAGRLLELVSRVTHAKLVSRDMFRARVERGEDVFAHELLYPVLQGWDSVELGSDLTIVGSDQLFNEMMGRFFQEREGMRPQVVLTTRITPGLDGVRKQSKTLNNFIALDDGPRDMFGKAMTLPDALIADWMEVYTGIPDGEVREAREALASRAGDPRELKARLAEAIVERYHGAAAGRAERAWFDASFARREFPEDAPRVALAPDASAVDLVVACLGCSRSEARRLVSQGGLWVDGAKVGIGGLEGAKAGGGPDGEGPRPAFPPGARVRVGKRGFFRVHLITGP